MHEHQAKYFSVLTRLVKWILFCPVFIWRFSLENSANCLLKTKRLMKIWIFRCTQNFSQKNIVKWKQVSIKPARPIQLRYYNNGIETQYRILLIIQGTFNVGIDNLAEKPYIPQKNLLQWICCKCLAWWHGHSYFWPQRSWRLLEAKNTPRRPKLSWRSWFIEKSI